MKHTVSMSAALAAAWLLLSGHYEALLLILGALSVAFVIYLGHRMAVIDHESHPMHLSGALVTYWPWLLWQMIKSSLDVSARILTPGRSISPTLVRANARQKSDLGRAIHANSITLTPGTVSLVVADDHIEVHALSREAAREIEAGTIDARVPDAGDPHP